MQVTGSFLSHESMSLPPGPVTREAEGQMPRGPGPQGAQAQKSEEWAVGCTGI